MPSGPSLVTLTALVASQEAMRENLGQQAQGLATQAATDYAAWYSADAVAEWSTELASNVGAVLANLAGLTDAYLTTVIGELTGKWVRAGRPIDTRDLRNGTITHPEAYARAASAYRFQQSRLDKATLALASDLNPKVPRLHLPVDIAVNRAKQVANRDVLMTVAQQSQKTLAAAGERGLITGWRRMVHPELSRTGTCGLCIAASTRIYKSGDLMPIHDNCNCLPMPITDSHDPGLKLDRAAFAQLYGAAGNTSREALKKTRYTITENGELGPVLAPAGAKQRTPLVVKRDTQNPRPVSDAKKAKQLADLRDSLQRSLPRLETLAATDESGRWADYRDTVADRIHQLGAQLPAA